MSGQNLKSCTDGGKSGHAVAQFELGAYVYPVVPSEFTNWRDEQRAWRESVVLFDQSHHMAEFPVKGPDALKLMSYCTVNSFANFPPNKAKQMVPCSYDGYVIGDGILFYLDKDELVFVGRAPSVNWLQFQAETGGLSRCDSRRSLALSSTRQGGHPPALSFSNPGTERGQGARAAQWRADAGREVLQHGHHQHQGLQSTRTAPRHGRRTGSRDLGALDEGDEIRDTILEAGREFGIGRRRLARVREQHARVGWIPSPLPAVYTGEKMKRYREWLPAGGYEGTGSIGGSFVSDKIEDYYMTPYELGYGGFSQV